jgi:hypothetical protein
LYGCLIWPLILKEEHKLKLFEIAVRDGDMSRDCETNGREEECIYSWGICGLLRKPSPRIEYNIKMDIGKWDQLVSTRFIWLSTGTSDGLLLAW